MSLNTHTTRTVCKFTGRKELASARRRSQWWGSWSRWRNHA